MPTNDERREVAARLTRISSGAWRDTIRGLLVKVARALDVPTEGTCVNMLSDIFERLAEFIEPEERTCRMEPTGDGSVVCSACRTEYTSRWLHEGEYVERYCPNCGARVEVDQ